MLVSLLLLSHLAGHQPETISLRQYGAPVSSILVEIEKATGEEYSWDAELAGEPVILKVTNRPPLEVRETLAKLLCAEWGVKDGHPHLQRRKDEWQALRTKETELRLAALNEAKETAAKGIKTFDWNEEEGTKSIHAFISKMMEDYKGVPTAQLPGFGAPTRNIGSPAYQLLQSLLREIPAQLLDGIGPEESVVFSDHPNRLQKRIDVGTAGLISTFNTQQAAMITAVKREVEQNAPDARFFGGAFSARVAKGGVKKLMLRVGRVDRRSAFQVRLWVIDGENSVCGEARSSIAAAVSSAPESPLNPTQAEAVSVRPATEALCMNLAKCDTQMINAALYAGGPSNGRGLGFSVLAATNPRYLELLADAQATALRPDVNEPIGQLPGDYVLGLADAVQMDVIALLPDEAVVSSGRFAQTGRVTPGRIPEWLRSLGCEVRLEGDLVVIQPMRPVEVFENRTDRSVLAKFLEPFGKRRMPRIPEMKKYIESGKMTGILDRAYVRLFSQNIEDTVFSSEMSRACVLLIAPYAKDPILKGSFPLNMNTSRKQIDAIVMSGEMAENMERNAEFDRHIHDPRLLILLATDDPTEKYAGGLPAQIEGTMSAEVYDEFAVYDEANGRIDYLTAESLMLRAKPEDEFSQGRQDVTLPRFKYYQARIANLGLDIPALGLSTGFLDINIADAAEEMSATRALEIIKTRGINTRFPPP
jgi:hypothetical protein